jgi:transposase
MCILMNNMRRAVEIQLESTLREQLQTLSRSGRTALRLVERCRIVLLAAEGLENREIAQHLDITRQKAGRWSDRFAEHGLAGIEKDAPRSGRIPEISKRRKTAVVRKTLEEKPVNATHWSRASMATATGMSPSTVGRVWRIHGLKPHLLRTFKLSNDKQFTEKLQNIVGLYLNPPERALVLSCDEKSQMQALDRTQPGLPLKKGRGQTMTHDYKRNGTSSLFAALNVLDGSIIGSCKKKHRHQEWLQFLNLIKRNVPKDQEIHLICDNYATHKHAKVKDWFARNKRFHCHFTPTSASWLNMVERFFRDISEQCIRRGVFKSVKELNQSVSAYITQHNEDPKPFIWTAKATDILAKVKRARQKL